MDKKTARFIVDISVDILCRFTFGTNFLKGDHMFETKGYNSKNSDGSISEFDRQKILDYTGRKRITNKLLDGLKGLDPSLFEKDYSNRDESRDPNRFSRDPNRFKRK